jgi:hypothetical protein
MKKELNESIRFLLNEYKRLQLKEKNNSLTKKEGETLKSLKLFIGNNKNE